MRFYWHIRILIIPLYTQSKMSSNEAVIGLMDSAYFVSKNDLLKWINDTLLLDLVFIQDLGSGSIYCQLLDAYCKQAVPMGKVSWKAKFQYEFVANLKLFQQGLERINSSKKIDVNKLAKARYQDNLQLIQWLKRYLQMTATRISPYHPQARRNGQSFHSHHAHKNSYVNRPAKPNLNSTLIPTTSAKKETFPSENPKNHKLERIKKILQGTQDGSGKLDLISDVVYGEIRKALFNKNFNCEKIQQEPQ